LQKEDEMAVKIFLNMDPIPGEAQDMCHRNMIEVQGWSGGVSQMIPNSPNPSTSTTAARPIIQNLSITKWIDKATPKIYELAFQGKQVRECRLTCCKKERGKYLEILLSNCMLVSVFLPGGKNDEDKLTETLAIRFGKVEVLHSLRDASGNLIPVKFG
jgi:type VI secretion system secreted protein Hcp